MLKQQMRASAYHLKPVEIKKLVIASANFLDRCVIKTLYWLGLRRHELVNLDARDIDFERKRVNVRRGKGEKTRIVPMIDDEHIGDLKHLLGGRNEGPVFLFNQNKALSMRAVNYIIESIGEKAGIENQHTGRVHLNPHFRVCLQRVGSFFQWIIHFKSLFVTMRPALGSDICRPITASLRRLFLCRLQRKACLREGLIAKMRGQSMR